ncbi:MULTISPECIES: hypothetical protein [Bradyrhizobium]|uniref:hypothetical protein n=1 Tax=Bradyrhizobium TaxID=374 RepID=UPI00067EDF24|nr:MULTISPECIES: hypothetical protein [Bradyrhizobium]PAY04124.1 hypothetical protein CK489_33180 [Bradyrhizobium sp. UFLA03-84]
MRKLSATAALATIAILLAPAATVAQGTGSGSGTASPPTVSPTSPQVTSPPPGTNSAGTAQSSGRLNTGEGVTTGAASSESFDKAIADENKAVEHRLKGICRGC